MSRGAVSCELQPSDVHRDSVAAMSLLLVATGETTLTQWLASNSRSASGQIDSWFDEF